MIDYNGNRYIYRVTETKVVPPTDFSVVQQTKVSQLTIITCTPVGTNTNRLVVHAKQIFPYPQDRSGTTNPSLSKQTTQHKLPE
jgi:sortase A